MLRNILTELSPSNETFEPSNFTLLKKISLDAGLQILWKLYLDPNESSQADTDILSLSY